MKVLSWGACAAMALMLAGGSAFASDTDDMSAMKATMDNMKQEMEAMRSTMASEREAMRANAGGAPESLKSANGKATVKIGGEFQVRYSASFDNDYNNVTSSSVADRHDNTRYTRTAWDIYKCELDFTIDFTPDTMGFIGLRPDRGVANVGASGLLDQAWWKWSNIGGCGFSAKVGLFKPNIGMYDSDVNPWGRVMILDPFTKNAARNASQEGDAFDANNVIDGNIGGNSLKQTLDKRVLGTAVTYTMDQVAITAGIYGQQVSLDEGMDNTLGVTRGGDARNLDIENHYITATYDPCWLENLHFQATYFGEFDQGGGVPATYLPANMTTALQAANHGADYTPGFIFGAFYKADKWAVYGETTFVANPNYYQDSNELLFSLGADYSLTEKLKIGGSFDWKQLYGSRYYGNVNPANVGGVDGTSEAYSLRAGLGAKYDFGNGLYVQAQYAHYWVKTWGVQDSNCKDADQIIFQTGFKF